jgi:hypothetical protein
MRRICAAALALMLASPATACPYGQIRRISMHRCVGIYTALGSPYAHHTYSMRRHYHWVRRPATNRPDKFADRPLITDDEPAAVPAGRRGPRLDKAHDPRESPAAIITIPFGIPGSVMGRPANYWSP